MKTNLLNIIAKRFHDLVVVHAITHWLVKHTHSGKWFVRLSVGFAGAGAAVKTSIASE